MCVCVCVCVCQDLWKYSTQICSAEWPQPYQPKAPCPTIKAVEEMASKMYAQEEAKRMKPMAGMVGTVPEELAAAAAAAAAATKAAEAEVVAELDVRIDSVLSEGLPVPDAEIQSS